MQRCGAVTDHDDKARLTVAELEGLFDRLFPLGIAGPDVLAEIAPEGWHDSPLLACFHPSAEQLYRETLQVHRNVEQLLARRKHKAGEPEVPPEPELTLEEVRAEWKETPVDVAKEVADLVGMCLWDIFSDNHEVFVADGRLADTGSFRASAGFIDAWISGRAGFEGDHLRFYLGSIWIRSRGNLIPAYQIVFRRLRALGADWTYHFPQIQLVELHSPDNHEPRREVDEFRSELADIQREARRDARLSSPPEVVRAYELVYGRAPRGWPPA